MALKVGELYASFGIDSSGLSSSIAGIEKKCSDLAASLAKTGAALSLSVTTPIVAFGKSVISVGSDFQAQMSRVQAISDATNEELALLTQTAKDLGAETSFSATEAADGMENLASAGFDVNEIIEAMPGMLDLAASSGEDLATSADIAASVLRGFGLEASEAGHVADVLATNAARTNAAVYDTGEAMKYIAPVANTMGLSLEEVAAAIGILSNSGIKGSQAGTTLRGALTRLAKPTDLMRAKMDELNLSFYDSDGEMKSLSEMVSMLRTNMAGLTDEQKQNALVTLFGQEALSGMMVLMEAGPEELDELTKAYENCGGAAEEMANIMLDNLKGDIEAASGSLETLKLNLYDYLEPAMRQAVQAAGGLIDSFNELDDSTKEVVYKVVGLAAAAGPVIAALGGIVGIVGKLVPLITTLVSPMGIIAGGLELMAIAAVDANNDIGRAFEGIAKKAKSALKQADSNITKTFKTISGRIPALAKSIANGFADIIPGVIDVAGSAVVGFMDTITDNAQNIADVGKSIITSLAEGLSNNIPRLIPAAANMMVSIGTALIRNIPSLAEAAGNIAGAIFEGIKNTDWKALGLEIISAISDAISGLVDVFTGWFESAKEAVQNISWGDIWESIKSGFNVASDWLKNLILGDAATDSATWADVGKKIWTWIQSGITVTGDWLKELVLGEEYTPDASWIDVGKALWNKIKEGIKTTGDWLKELVLGDAYTPDASWADAGGAIVNKISEGLNALLGDGGAGLVEKLGDMSGFVTTLASKILSGRINVVAGVSDFLSGLVAKIGEFDGWSTLGDGLSVIATALIDGITGAIPKVANAAATIVDAIGTVLNEAFSSGGLVESMGDVAATIINGLSEAISGLGDLGTTLIGAIGDMLGNIDWSSAGESVKNAATSIVEALGNALRASLDGGQKIMSAIGDMIKGVDWGEAGHAVADVCSGLVSALASEIGKTDFTGFMSSLGDAIGAAASGLVTAAVSIVVNLVSGLFTGDTWAMLWEAGKALLEGIWAGIKSTAESLFPSLGETLKYVLLGDTSSGGFGADVTITIDGVEVIADSATAEAAAIIKEQFEQGEIVSVEQAVYVASQLVMTGQLTGDSVDTEFIEEYAKQMLAGAEIEAPVGVDVQPQMDENWASNVDAAIQSATSSTSSMTLDNVEISSISTVSLSEGAKSTISSAGEEAGQLMTQNMATKIDEGIEDINTSINGVATTVTTTLDPLPEQAGTVGTEVVTALSDAITDNTETATGAMETLASGVTDAASKELSHDNGYKIGSSYVSAIKSGIDAMKSAVKTAASSMASSVRGAASLVLSYSAGHSIGVQFDNGIAAGIRKGTSAITSAARTAARAAYNAAVSELEIGSPSKLAERGIGYMYDAGLAKGILGRVSLIENAARKVVSTMHDMFLVGDPSRNTVYTAQQSIQQTAQETAAANGGRQTIEDRADAIGRAIADRLIETGALNGDVIMDNEKVGERVSSPVSRTIARKSRSTIRGRSAQGVFA